jgi:hypothetical protein
MAKPQKQKKTTPNNDIHAEIRLGDPENPVIVKAVMTSAMQKQLSKMAKELRFQRGGLNASLISFQDEDVQRIVRNKGLDPIRPKNRREKLIRDKIIRLVQNHHIEIQQGASSDAFFILLLDDLFLPPAQNSKGTTPKVELRPDVLALVDGEILENRYQEYFAEPEDYEPRNMPSPVSFDESVVAEQKVAYLSALQQLLPEMTEQMKKIDGFDFNESESETPPVDDAGFQS